MCRPMLTCQGLPALLYWALLLWLHPTDVGRSTVASDGQCLCVWQAVLQFVLVAQHRQGTPRSQSPCGWLPQYVLCTLLQ